MGQFFYKSCEMCVHWTAGFTGKRCVLLYSVADKIQCHKAGWLASGTHKYLDDRDLIVPTPRLRADSARCTATFASTLVRSLARATATGRRLQLHTPGLDLELIRGEVTSTGAPVT